MDPIDHFVADVEASGEDQEHTMFANWCARENPAGCVGDMERGWMARAAIWTPQMIHHMNMLAAELIDPPLYTQAQRDAYAAEAVKQERERFLAILESEKKGWAYHQPSAYHVAESALDDAIEAIQKDQP